MGMTTDHVVGVHFDLDSPPPFINTQANHSLAAGNNRKRKEKKMQSVMARQLHASGPEREE